jgi:hypothetical protein
VGDFVGATGSVEAALFRDRQKLVGLARVHWKGKGRVAVEPYIV